ncbi:hypothetical protein D477_010114 [Arthrobacter crystallopoietes BAB-32]|uniref:Uncharacterized protein n=1 Tax=Arthrobacter crystallopoietes BAB-32 TaxID=1246476 RepID=N1V7Y5_9MICC|nr:hypothetical protein [Arthrobacter crystallopoietes]EMY34343.1 hypothetical protein D477_010114 [Arthrobacter crystallopoietes BAB-32]
MPPTQPSSDRLKEILSRIFDSQILNHGDYNLVFAAASGQQGQVPGASSTGKYYVVGYRWRPQELVIAPFDGTTLTASGTPVEINMTNLSHAVVLAGGDYEVGTSTGRIFRFAVQPQGQLPLEGHVIDQDDDEVDFSQFMASFIAAA